MTDNPSAEILHSLLRTVENDTSQASPNRDRIRTSVLAEFDRALDGAPEDVAVVELVDLAAHLEHRTPTRRRSLVWIAGAAAAILLAVGIVSAGDQFGIETNEPAASPDELRLVEDQEGRDLLLQGEQRTDLIGGGLSFVAPGGLVATTHEPGLLVLEPQQQLDGVVAQLVIAEVPLSDWEAELETLVADGLAQSKEIGITIGGSPTTRYDITLTNTLVVDRECRVAVPCLRLDGWPETGPVALWAGTDNRTVEIGRTETNVVLAIEITERFPDPLSTSATTLLATARLDPG